MKTLFRSVLVGLISFILFSLSPLSGQSTVNMVIQAREPNLNRELLDRSVKVMDNRLNSVGIKATGKVNYQNAQIAFVLPADINKAEVELLLTNKGNIGFYETLSLNEIAELLKKAKPDSKIEWVSSQSDSRIACNPTKDPGIVEKVSDYLKEINLSGNTKLVWSQLNSKAQTCLYILKTDNAGHPALSGADIEKVTTSKDKKSQSNNIGIKFNSKSAVTWSGLTEKNLNKPIAIVMDNLVYYAPVVKTPIKNGLCEISGNMSDREVSYFLALVNNGELATDFTVK
jgi:preprotein translocase subunit SecD